MRRSPAEPISLGPNQIPRFYKGGSRIAAFRGLPPAGDDAPEDWVASSTPVHGEDEVGLTRLGDGTRLLDRFARDPEAFFEPEHRERFGDDSVLLLKLLDAGERLPVHVHPDDAFATSELDVSHGKTEGWVILDAAPGAVVHLGFSRNLDEDELGALVAGQEPERILSQMNRLSVAAGDSIFVPAGLPHAIGEGILLLELQEPSDLSLLLEWRGLMSETEAFLGLSPEVALQAVTRSRLLNRDVDRLRERRGRSLFPPEADGFFRADLIEGSDPLEPSFSVLVVYEGTGALRSEFIEVPVERGATVLVPFAVGETELTGSCRAIRCRPPSSAA